MYGTGLRLQETLRLRIKDIDFGRKDIIVQHSHIKECQRFHEVAIQQT
jgi:integrase